MSKNKKIKLSPKQNIAEAIPLSTLKQHNKIAIPVIPGKSFKEAIQLSRGEDKLLKELYSSEGVDKLVDGNKGTKIPYLWTVYGNFLVNPCTISMNTLWRIFEKHDVTRRCHETNVSTLTMGIGEYYHDVEEYQNFIRYALKVLKGGINQLIVDMASSMGLGSYIGVMIEDVDNDGYTIVKEVSYRPPSSIAFTADPEGNHLNTYQYVYNYPAANMQNMLSYGYADGAVYGNNVPWGNNVDTLAPLGDLPYPMRTTYYNVYGLVQLDPEYVIHYAFDRLGGKSNPYGYPLTAASYDLYLMDTAIAQQEMGAYARYANPLLAGFADAMTTVQYGNESISSVEALYYALERYTSQAAIILPGKKGQDFDLEVLQTKADFAAFTDGRKNSEERTQKLWLQPSGIYEASTSYAGMTAQNTIYSRNMATIRSELLDKVKHTLIKRLLHKNFGTHITDFGRFETALLSIDDQAKQVKIYSELTNLGFMSPSNYKQTNYVYKTMGLPEISKEDFNELQQDRAKDKELGDIAKTHDNTRRADVQETADHYSKQSITDGLR